MSVERVGMDRELFNLGQSACSLKRETVAATAVEAAATVTAAAARTAAKPASAPVAPDINRTGQTGHSQST